jgi:diacylglycerol kinase family enzyme
MRDKVMRILLVHNPKAGSEEHEGDTLMEALKKAGHKPRYQSSKTKGFAKALKEKTDLVLVAGGDGTVGKIARHLIGRKIPLSVLPLGTANNLARTLGFHRSVETLIAQLKDGESSKFDVGLARGPWGKRYFFEGAGAGLLAEYLQAPLEMEKDETPSKKAAMKRHVEELRQWLSEQPAREWRIMLDKEDVSGRYLLWQAMNIRSVGPVLTLAPEARADDGEFDFVGLREPDRPLLLEHLEARLQGMEHKFTLPTVKFRKMRLSWKKSPLHFDDESWPPEDEKPPDPCEIKIEVKPSVLRIWKSRAS